MFAHETISLAIPHARHFAADEVFSTCHDELDSSQLDAAFKPSPRRLGHAALVATNKTLSCLGKNPDS